jgi:hypothetical protein
LDKCCEYWYYHFVARDKAAPEEFKFPVEMALELLIAADFLDCIDYEKRANGSVRFAVCLLGVTSGGKLARYRGKHRI